MFADKLWGDGKANTLWGKDGRDELYGRDGDDTLYGGRGADALHGGAGSDTAVYWWASSTTTTDASGAEIARGVTADLQDSTRNTGEAAGDSYNLVENLAGSMFADKLWGDGKANTLWGKDGQDELYGGAGDDRLEGGKDRDTLYLGGGSDTVVFGRGDGHDTVAADGFDADSTDKVVFGIGVKTEDLWFKESSGDLKISMVGTEDSLTLKGWFGAASPAGRMDEFHLSGGEILVESRVHALVTAMTQAAAHGAGPAGLAELPNDETAYRSFTSALETAWQSTAGG